MLLILIYHLVTIVTATQSTSTITHLNESKALFLSKGELVLTNSFAHLICDFDLTQLHEHLANLYTIRTQVSMINITENWPQAGASPAKREKLARRVAFVNNFINTTEKTYDPGTLLVGQALYVHERHPAEGLRVPYG